MASSLIAIVGETASGKSALALDLARRLNGEIICADSWTVYKGLDIGTAKPTLDERAKVPHHLLDIVSPHEGFSAAVFQRLAVRAVEDIASRNRLPILVGGTGLYIDSVLFNYSFLPQHDAQIRKELNLKNLDELLTLAKMRKLDVSQIDVRNKRRVIRLIENNGMQPTRNMMRDNTLVLGLSIPRDVLKDRVAKRVNAMFHAGLENEVRELVARYGWKSEALKGIGYREWVEYFAGTQSLDETRDRIIKATMDLAKRQRTWFKRNSSIQWITDRCYADDIVTTFLNKSS